MALRLEILLEAIDRVTAPVERVRARIAAVAAPVLRVAQATAALGRVAGVQVLARALGGVAGAARQAVSAVAQLASRAALLGIGAGAAGVAAFNGLFLRGAAEMEQFGIVLEVLEGDQQRARQSIAWISDFARRTPYELRQVVDAFVRLRGAGVDAQQFLESVGNAAAARSKTLEQAAEAFNDAIVGEFERLKEFGITASREGQRVTLEYAVRGQQFRRVIDATNREIVASIRRAWEPIGSFFEILWGGISAAFEAAWARIRPIVDLIGRAASLLEGTGTGSDPERQAERGRNWNGRARLGGFPMPPGLDEPPGPASAVPTGPAARVDAGGQLNIRVEDGRVAVRGRPADPRMEWNLDRGLAMETP